MTGGCAGQGGVHDRESMHGRGCVAGGMCGGGMHGRRHVWQGCVCGRGTCMAGEMATVADGMHPTGMHSCLMKFTHYSKGWSS